MSIRLLVAARPRDEIGAALASQLPGVSWAFRSDPALSDLGGVEAILVGSARREFSDVDFAAMPSLRFVQQLYAGVDGFPFARVPRSVRVAGNVGGMAPFVAEHAVALGLAAARDLSNAWANVRGGQLRPAPEHRLIVGRTATILGYGEIGRGIAQRLEAFGAHVVGVNRTGRMAPGVEGMYAADRLLDAIRGADFVFEARPLTRATRATIGRPELEAISPTGVFVNVGRAGTVDARALFEHLRDHPDFRAALDVWWTEHFDTGRLAEDYAWSSLPNLVGTPHCAAAGPGVESYALARAVANLARFFDGVPPEHLVDRDEYAEDVDSTG